jgi:hypothetical protein
MKDDCFDNTISRFPPVQSYREYIVKNVCDGKTAILFFYSVITEGRQDGRGGGLWAQTKIYFFTAIFVPDFF